MGSESSSRGCPLPAVSQGQPELLQDLQNPGVCMGCSAPPLPPAATPGFPEPLPCTGLGPTEVLASGVGWGGGSSRGPHLELPDLALMVSLSFHPI